MLYIDSEIQAEWGPFVLFIPAQFELVIVYIFLNVTYHPIYSMNNCVANTSKLPLDGAQLFRYMG